MSSVHEMDCLREETVPVSGAWGESRGFSPEVHNHLHSFDRIKLQVVKTADSSSMTSCL